MRYLSVFLVLVTILSAFRFLALVLRQRRDQPRDRRRGRTLCFPQHRQRFSAWRARRDLRRLGGLVRSRSPEALLHDLGDRFRDSGP